LLVDPLLMSDSVRLAGARFIVPLQELRVSCSSWHGVT
jgi:hypothetical protein